MASIAVVRDVPKPVSERIPVASALNESMAKPDFAARPNVKVATVASELPPADPLERRGENSRESPFNVAGPICVPSSATTSMNSTVAPVKSPSVMGAAHTGRTTRTRSPNRQAS